MAQVLAVAGFELEGKAYAKGTVITMSAANAVWLKSRKLVEDDSTIVAAAISGGATQIAHYAALPQGFQGISSSLNEIWSLGDSICANGYAAPTSAADVWFSGDNWLNWACVLSVGALTWGGVSALGGITSGTCIDKYLPAIIAAKPRFCAVHVGTNDYGQTGYATDGSTTRANLLTIYTTLLAAGIIPIATAFLPKASLTGASASIQQRLTLWVAKTARRLGIPYCDWSPQLFKSDGTGAWVSAAYSSDGTHMLEPAAKLMGASLLSSIQPWLTPGVNYFAHVQNNSNLTSHTPCSTNALNLTDTNADGLADGWYLNTGAGTPTLTAMSASEGMGNWQNFTATGAGNYQNTGSNVAMTPGNKYLLAMKFKTAGVVSSGGQFTIRLADANSNPIVQLLGLKSDVTLGALYREFVWPSAAATNNARLECLVQGANAVLSVGQYICMDMTANGLV